MCRSPVFYKRENRRVLRTEIFRDLSVRNQENFSTFIPENGDVCRTGEFSSLGFLNLSGICYRILYNRNRGLRSGSFLQLLCLVLHGVDWFHRCNASADTLTLNPYQNDMKRASDRYHLGRNLDRNVVVGASGWLVASFLVVRKYNMLITPSRAFFLLLQKTSNVSATPFLCKLSNFTAH